MIYQKAKLPQIPTSSLSRVSGTRSGLFTKLHTVDEFADLLGVSPRTVQRLIKSRALPAYRIGRLVRISDADAKAFLEELRGD
jgi:excisionase family DNA binding protein